MWHVYTLQYSSVMSNDKENESKSADDEYNAKTDGTDAVEYGSCQHPLHLYAFLHLNVIQLLFFSLHSSRHNVSNVFHKLVHRLDVRGFQGRSLGVVTLRTAAVAVSISNAPSLSVHLRSFER